MLAINKRRQDAINKNSGNVDWGEDYIPYYVKNVYLHSDLQGKIGNPVFNNFAFRTQTLNTFNEYQKGVLEAAGFSDEDISDLLTGKTFKDVGETNLYSLANNEDNNIQNFKNISKSLEVGDKLQKALFNAKEDVKSIDEVIRLLQEFINTYVKENNNLAKSYLNNSFLNKFLKLSSESKGKGAGALFISEKRYGYEEGFYGKDPCDRAVNAALDHIIHRNANSAFSLHPSVKSNASKLPADLGRLKTGLEIISTESNALFRKKSFSKFKGHGINLKELGTGNEIYQLFLDSLIRSLFTLQNDLTEILAMKGAAKLFSKLGHSIIDMAHTGSNSATMNVTIDPDLKKALEEADKNASINMEIGSGKADFTLTSDRGSGTIGFSVKDYDSIKFDENNVITSNAAIHIQGGTNLYTLLVREANFSYGNVVDIIRVASGMGVSENTNESINSIWEELKQLVVKLSFLDALTGYRQQGAGAIFMVLNGRLFLMQDIVQRILQDPVNNLSMSQVGAAKGLDRETYVAQNIWWLDEDDPPSVNKAKNRSKMMYKAAIRTMNATKLNISIKNLAGLKAL